MVVLSNGPFGHFADFPSHRKSLAAIGDDGLVRPSGSIIQQLDALRASGQLLPLSFAGQGYAVVIAYFHADIRQLPLWVDYSISCVVVTNGAHGILGAVVAGVDALVTADLTAAIALAS